MPTNPLSPALAEFLPVWINQPTIVDAEGLRNELTGSLVAGAAIEAAIHDYGTGDQIGLPVAFSEISSATYAAVLPASLPLVEGDLYEIRVDVSDPIVAHWRLLRVAAYRYA